MFKDGLSKNAVERIKILKESDDGFFIAEEDLKLSQVRYAQGSTTILEVLNAQVSVVQARSSLVRSKYDAFIQQATLKALLGTLDNEYENE